MEYCLKRRRIDVPSGGDLEDLEQLSRRSRRSYLKKRELPSSLALEKFGQEGEIVIKRASHLPAAGSHLPAAGSSYNYVSSVTDYTALIADSVS